MFSDRLEANFECVRLLLDEAELDLDISFHAAATKARIERCEMEIALTLPGEFRTFLLEHDGLELSIRSRRDNYVWAILNVLGTATVPAATHRIREYCRATAEPGQNRDVTTLVAVVDLFDDDHCIMLPGPVTWPVYEVISGFWNDWQHAEPIAHDFEDFMDKVIANLIAGSDIYYWSGEPPVWETTAGSDD